MAKAVKANLAAPRKRPLRGSQVGVRLSKWFSSSWCAVGQLVVFDTAVSVMVRHWSSSIFHEPLPDDRLRDPFPLPRLKQRGIADRGLCRTTARRVLRRNHVILMTNRVVDSLKLLFFGELLHPTSLQLTVLRTCL